MKVADILTHISRGRTDLIFKLMRQPQWQDLLDEGHVKPLQWLIYYNDLTALKAVLESGSTLDTIDLNVELGNAAFFGHWKICEFLISHGADIQWRIPDTHETPLHNALSKAGRPYYLYTVRLLVEKGAEVNVQTIPGKETGAFMRDVRTCGETPLHRAAAYADAQTIRFLLDHGADKTFKDAHGDTPLSWASRHLRPGEILHSLAFGQHNIGVAHVTANTSDHGNKWGSAMDWNLFGEYLLVEDRRPVD